MVGTQSTETECNCSGQFHGQFQQNRPSHVLILSEKNAKLLALAFSEPAMIIYPSATPKQNSSNNQREAGLQTPSHAHCHFKRHFAKWSAEAQEILDQHE